MSRRQQQRCRPVVGWVLALAITCLSGGALGDEPGQLIPDPGFRPYSPYADDFVANAGKSRIVVLPTLVRREGRTAHSFASQRQIVASLNESGIIKATARNRRIDLGPLRRPSQWEIFEYGALRIAEKLQGYETGTDYTLVMELLVPTAREVFGIEVYILDSHGNNAFSFLLNSHHTLFADAKLMAGDSSEAARSKMVEKATSIGLKALEAQLNQLRACLEEKKRLIVPRISAGVLHDFEAPPRSVTGADNFSLGFSTFSDGQSRVAIAQAKSHPPMANEANGNAAMKLSLDVTGWAGVIYLNPDASGKKWGAQDWRDTAGLSFWLHGNNSGAAMFFDVIDNRRPCSRWDDAERYTYEFWDDVSGWRQIHIRFAEMARKDIGNGAPDDGLNLDEVHGWGLGATNTGGSLDFYVDELRLWVDEPEELSANAERIAHDHFTEIRLGDSMSKIIVDPGLYQGLAVEKVMTLSCECARLTVDRGFRYFRMDERARFAGGRGSFRLTFYREPPAGTRIARGLLAKDDGDRRQLMTALQDAEGLLGMCVDLSSAGKP